MTSVLLHPDALPISNPEAMHFDLHGTPGNNTAPAAKATQTFGMPVGTVNTFHAPSFPFHQAPSLTFGSAGAVTHASHTGPPSHQTCCMLLVLSNQ